MSKNQVLKHIEENKILREEQSGFRRGFSCETALQDTLIEWRVEMDESKIIGVVFIDFKRAFETTNIAYK